MKQKNLKKLGLRRLLKRMEHARATANGIAASLSRVTEALFDLRTAGHKTAYRKGKEARWVVQQAFVVPEHVNRGCRRIQIQNREPRPPKRVQVA